MALLLYFVAYFLLAFVWRSLRVYTRTGVNPLVLPSSDAAYGYVGCVFKFVMVGCAVVVAIHAVSPAWERALGRLPFLQYPLVASPFLRHIDVEVLMSARTYIAETQVVLTLITRAHRNAALEL